MNNWYECEHEWRDRVDSQSSNEGSVDVVCVKCKCPGERNLQTGEVFWPTT